MKNQGGRERPAYPLEKRPGHHEEGFIGSHPAFGIIEISRVSGRFENLAGVDYPQGHAVAIRIKHADIHRAYGGTTFMENKLCVEGYLSEVQFAQAISSLNSAERVPITLRYYPNGDGLFDPGEPPPHMLNVEELGDEAVEPLKTGIAALEEALALAKEGKVKKSIVAAIEKAHREIVLNTEFREHQARKGIRKAADKAKMEISAFAQQVVRQFGLQRLGADKALLIEAPSEVPETPMIEQQGDD